MKTDTKNDVYVLMGPTHQIYGLFKSKKDAKNAERRAIRVWKISYGWVVKKVQTLADLDAHLEWVKGIRDKQ